MIGNKSKKKLFRYDMRVVETVEYSAVVEADKPVSYRELEKIAEKRRVKGSLSMEGVKDVKFYLADSQTYEAV